MTSKIITQSELKSLLDYDPETGIFVWKERPVTRQQDSVFNSRWAGKQLGSLAQTGYMVTTIRCQRLLLHRVAFLYMTGEWPKNKVDHINQNRADNRWSNLRDVTHSQNLHNSNKTRGYVRCQNRWKVEIMVNRKLHRIGRFKTELAAAYAYHVAKVSLLESSEQRP